MNPNSISRPQRSDSSSSKEEDPPERRISYQSVRQSINQFTVPQRNQILPENNNYDPQALARFRRPNHLPPLSSVGHGSAIGALEMVQPNTQNLERQQQERDIDFDDRKTLASEDDNSFNRLYDSHEIWSKEENSKTFLGKFRRFTFEHKETIFCWYMLICTGLWIALIILCRNKEASLRGLSGILNTLNTNLNSLSLFDITTVGANLSCPTNYSLLSLGKWPGTISSCYCGWDDSYDIASTCSFSQQRRGCFQIPKISSINYTNWHQNSFCVQYIIGALTNQTVCPLNYVTCHVGGCYPKSFGCPITNISFSSNIGQVKFVKDGISPPVIFLLASPNGLPCLENIATAKAPVFPPLNFPKPTGCESNDPAANYTLGSYNQNLFYFDNGMSSVFNIENYATYLTGELSVDLVLMQRYPIKNTTICLIFDMGCFNSITNTIETYINAYFSLSITGFTFLIVFFMVFAC